MAACAIEALLLANVLAFEPDMERDGTWPESRKPPEQWHLPELVRFHRDQGWIKADDPLAPQLAEAVEAMNELRIVLVHPGRLIRDAHEFESDDRIFSGMFGVLHATFDHTRTRLYGDADEDGASGLRHADTSAPTA